MIHCSKCLAPLPLANVVGLTCDRVFGSRVCGGLPVNGLPRLADFARGDIVRYVPYHAEGDLTHPDCEVGEVTSTNHVYVFVRFTSPHLRHFPQACAPDQLVREQRR